MSNSHFRTNVGRASFPLLLLTLISLFSAGKCNAQRVLEAKGFQTADNYGPPNETQVKSLLKGEKARPLENGLVQLTQAELSTFRTNGQPELLIRAPECLYDQPKQEVSSTGPLHVQTADGRFSIEGEGFLWEQTNSVLFISNRVHTIIQPELMESSGPNASAKASAQKSPVEIFSRRFEYGHAAGLGIYRDTVRVSGTNLNLAAETLTLKVPTSETNHTAALESITAQEHVSMSYGGIQATGQTAVYTAQTGLATITGHPSWRAEQRLGRGDELVIDRSNRVFQAKGQAWLRMPGQGLGSSGFLSGTNRLASRAAENTNRWIEITCRNYEFHTNYAVFHEHVRLNELVNGLTTGNLTCSTLTATFTGTNELQRLVAETNVRITEGDKLFTGAKAVFTARNGLLVMTGKPTWKVGPRRGSGDVVQVDTQHDEMLVRGNASIRLPAEELGQGTALPGQQDKKPPTKPTGPQEASIYCEEYRLQSNRGVFRGGVYATHPRMNWVCETLTVLTPNKDEKVLVAEQGVIFDLDLANEKHDKIHGTGDQAFYTNIITSTLTNDLLTLNGSPARLASANATNENNVIVLDRAHNQLISRGNYRLYGTTKAVDTNVFNLPKSKK